MDGFNGSLCLVGKQAWGKIELLGCVEYFLTRIMAILDNILAGLWSNFCVLVFKIFMLCCIYFDGVEMNERYEIVFVNLLASGDFKNAQWLLKIKPDINICFGNEYAFRYACCEGNIDIAKWLLKMKPSINISIHDNYAFRHVRRFGPLKIACWLGHFNPEYVYNENIANMKFRGIAGIVGTMLLFDLV